MMRTLVSALLFSALCSVSVVKAHEGHEHTYITETTAIAVGQGYAVQLAEQDAGYGFGKLPESWRKVSAKNVKLHRKGDGFYIVAVTNQAEQRTLYVLMTSNGDVSNANFTGEFEGL